MALQQQRPMARQDSTPDVILRRQLPRFNSKRSSSQCSTHEDDKPKASSGVQASPTLRSQDLESADALMADGMHAMNETLAAIVEEALGSPIPSIDVRFRDLKISAKVTLSTPPEALNGVQVPTLLTPAKNLVSKLCSRPHVVHRDILRGITGVFKPGRLTLVLGHPGSGKSSLMKILSGRFPLTRQMEFEGDIFYNDMARSDILDRLARYVAYVDQHDEHYARMTVQETFKFAAECCSGKELPDWMVKALSRAPAEQHEKALEVLTAHHRHAADLMIKKLSLEHVQDGIVGDALLKGVTAGEKKRVTVGEMAFGLKAVHLLDEISAGLDAGTTFDIIDSLKSMAVNFNRTVVVALQQPTPEVFALFDDVLVLNEGYVMYQGPRDQVLPYFSTLGFTCPPRKDIPDFLLELGTPKQQAYCKPQSDAAGGDAKLVPFTASEFATCFEQSEIFHTTLSYLQRPFEPVDGAMTPPRKEDLTPFRQHFVQDVALVLKRQWLLTTRNKAFLIARTFMVLLMGVLYGTTFWQLPDNNSQLSLGLLFSCSMFLSLGQAAQIPVFLNARSVFYKQRGAHFYRSASYVLASCVAQIPFALVETLLFGSLLYWMGGYVSLADHFVVFLVTLFLCQICFTAFFFCLASAIPTPAMAQPVMVVFILFFTLFGGFLVTKNNIPSYFTWIYWINPVQWCIRALAINQYTAPQFQVCTYKNVDYCKLYRGLTMSKYSLATFDLDDDTMWIYYCWIVFGASYVVLSVASYVFLEFCRYESPETTAAVAMDLAELQRRGALRQDHDNEEARVDEQMDTYMLQPATPKSSSHGGETLVPSRRSAPPPILEADELTLVIPRDGCTGFVPVTIAFEDLWYSVPMPGRTDEEEIDLLRGVSGFALPGTMTALMGSRGAGKTTLLDVLAGRKLLGKIRGEVFLNGYPATDLAIRRCTGYCEQVDVHSDSATIREAMMFSAVLRQDAAIPRIEKMVFVEECIDLLNLRSIADKIIRGSSKEQLKRISIGVELAASPSLLFVDEPTSGVDPRSALVIMNGLRKVADTGRTVICTIHQPSTDVFKLFDSTLLLQRGGRMVYFGETGVGEDCGKIIEYFAQIPGVKPLGAGYNPATWILEAINAHDPAHPRHGAASLTAASRQPHPRRRSSSASMVPVDIAAYFVASDQRLLLEEDLDQDGLTRPSLYLPEITFQRKRAASPLTQFAVLSKRFFRMHWRSPAYNLTRLMLSVVLAALFGVMYHGTKYDTFRGANAGVGMIFLSTLFFGLIAFNQVMPIAAAERAAFYRERASQTYNALWYFVASTIAEIPYVFFSALVFTAILFPLVGFEGKNEFAIYWLVTSLHVLLQVYMGQFLVYLLPNLPAATGLGALLNSIFLLFAGFNPPTSKIPSVYKWIYYASPPSYTISALSATVFTDCSKPGGSTLGCKPLQNAPQRLAGANLKIYIEKIFVMKHDEIWQNIAIIYGLTVAFRILGLLALRYINHQKK